MIEVTVVFNVAWKQALARSGLLFTIGGKAQARERQLAHPRLMTWQ
jgi:hypothetical protein